VSQQLTQIGGCGYALLAKLRAARNNVVADYRPGFQFTIRFYQRTLYSFTSISISGKQVNLLQPDNQHYNNIN
jgi:hypothetical protein